MTVDGSGTAALPLFGSEHARKYDRGIRITLPGYEALHDMARSLLRLDLKERARLLIVGSGTGTEILTLSEDNPGWLFTGVDPSSDMLTIARRQLMARGFQDRVDLYAARTHELPASRPYDAATAILVMHFLPDDGRKLELLQSISAKLRADAPFILSDLCGDTTSAQFARFAGAWRQRQLSLGMEEADVEEMFQQILSTVHFVPEERITALMHEAGFHEIERFYSALLSGGWVARKSKDATST